MLNKEALKKILYNLEFIEEKLELLHPDMVKKVIDDLDGEAGIISHSIGFSEEGRDIYSIELGTGDKKVFAVAGAHPDEPAGTVTLIHLARELVKLQRAGYCRDYKFFFIPQLDPDGASKNWEWMKKTYYYKNFLLFNFNEKNSGGRDIECGLPVSDNQSMRPEVKAFKDFIDKNAPVDYFVTLHSDRLSGGALFLINAPVPKDIDPVMEFLTEACNKENLEMWDVERWGYSFQKRLAPGFFSHIKAEDVRNFYKDNPEELKNVRLDTVQYAVQNCGAKFALVTEFPFFVDREMNNHEETKICLYDFELERIRQRRKNLALQKELWKELNDFPVTESNKKWLDFYEGFFEVRSRYLSAFRENMDDYRGKFATEGDLHDLYKEKMSNEYLIPLMTMRRLTGVENEKGRNLYETYETIFEEKLERYEKLFLYRPLSVSRQVKLQTITILSGLLVV